MLVLKANIHKDLGQGKLAVAHLQQADEAFAAAERKGLLRAPDYEDWVTSLYDMGTAYLASHELEPAKRCFLRILASPRLSMAGRIIAIKGVSEYHRARKEWHKMMECCEEVLMLLRDAVEALLASDALVATENEIYPIMAR
jgi:tetratricopeptide (TPR) repeat protein